MAVVGVFYAAADDNDGDDNDDLTCIIMFNVDVIGYGQLQTFSLLIAWYCVRSDHRPRRSQDYHSVES